MTRAWECGALRMQGCHQGKPQHSKVLMLSTARFFKYIVHNIRFAVSDQTIHMLSHTLMSLWCFVGMRAIKCCIQGFGALWGYANLKA